MILEKNPMGRSWNVQREVKTMTQQRRDGKINSRDDLFVRVISLVIRWKTDRKWTISWLGQVRQSSVTIRDISANPQEERKCRRAVLRLSDCSCTKIVVNIGRKWRSCRGHQWHLRGVHGPRPTTRSLSFIWIVPRPPWMKFDKTFGGNVHSSKIVLFVDSRRTNLSFLFYLVKEQTSARNFVPFEKKRPRWNGRRERKSFCSLDRTSSVRLSEISKPPFASDIFVARLRKALTLSEHSHTIKI